MLTRSRLYAMSATSHVDAVLTPLLVATRTACPTLPCPGALHTTCSPLVFRAASVGLTNAKVRMASHSTTLQHQNIS